MHAPLRRLSAIFVEMEYLVRQIDLLSKASVKIINGFFHKDNLQTIDRVKEIRNQTLQLYFLILGGCSIGDENFIELGIETTT